MTHYFQFIIIDDYSYDLYPLTENFSKGKLPIGNKPLIFYQLEHLEKNEIQGKA